MRRPRARPILRVLAGLLLISSAGCATDGAVRLAYCIERSAATLDGSTSDEVRASCDLRVPAGSVVVAFPPSTIPWPWLAEQGLSDTELDVLRTLQGSESVYARIHVVPEGRRPRPSRTTYHRRFVETPVPLVCRVSGSQVAIVLRREAGSIILADLESSP